MHQLEEFYISEELTNLCVLDNTSITPLALSATTLKKLVLSDVMLDNEALCLFGASCPLLQLVWLDNVSMRDKGVVCLIQKCQYLQDLHLGAVQPHSRHSLLRMHVPYDSGITDETIIAISNNCSQLKSLHLIGHPKVTSVGMEHLFTNQKLLGNLQELHLQHMTGICGMRCQDDTMINILRMCTNLKDLSLEGYMGNIGRVLEEVLPFIGKQLNSIDVRCCPQNSELACIAITDNCLYVKKVLFGQSVGLTVTGLQHLIKALGNNLEVLDLQNVICINDEVVTYILQFCKNIRDLNLGSKSPSTNNIGIQILSDLYQLQNNQSDLHVRLGSLYDIDARASFRYHYKDWYI
eukprot:TRINITY_DN18109_c0_g1_i1.p1 TRINITY_DN18109_c0_g1~~TRINITY_DN18109_c0_g1_i1.p1  ORF type:complete len:407 (+),score=19.96 TRINITY_DN18109_c0_g1_i1:169-1221(+)